TCSRYVQFLCLLSSLHLGAAVVFEIEAVSPRFCAPEEPHFDNATQRLIFADQFGKQFCSYDLNTNLTSCTSLDEFTAAIVPIKNSTNQFLAGIGPYLTVFTWDEISAESTYVVLARPETEAAFPGNFFNDGKADITGRFWIGSQGPLDPSGPSGAVPNRGSFYSYVTENCSFAKKIGNVSISDGLAWNSDYTTLFYIDSGVNTVDRFDFDIETGEISNRRTVIDYKETDIPGFAHGMTIDTEDYLYVTIYGGSVITRVDPNSGEVLMRIEMPMTLVADAEWGGPDLDVLYVTSHSRGLDGSELEEQPLAGRVVAVRGLNASGRVANDAIICLQSGSHESATCSSKSRLRKLGST
ncbi:regucalcin, partial [Bemisia tabaci]|uniref:regucalcin n=1 Tax=Bemisia tabaci TaxID=7038 RepID=UPI003B287A11